MEQIEIHRIQTSQMQTSFSTNTKLFHDFGCGTDESINDFGGGFTSNGGAEREHAVGILGGYCVYRIFIYRVSMETENVDEFRIAERGRKMKRTSP
jgi:hypothetical protein